MTVEAASVLLTAKEVAAMLRLSMRSFWRLKSEGAVPDPIRLGRSIRWSVRIISNWIERGCPVPERKR